MQDMKVFYRRCLLVAAVCFLAAGCQKEDVGTRLELAGECFNGQGSKMMVNGTDMRWVAGDEVRVNGITAAVAVDANKAYIDGDGLSAPYYAVIPASIYDGAIGGNVTVTLPSVYQYAEVDDGGTMRQNLQAPMAAYASVAGSRLEFKHLTGALTVRVTNSTGHVLYMDGIKVVSSNCRMSGDWDVDFLSLAGDGTPDASGGLTDAEKTVLMRFDSTALAINASATKEVQIPVPPVNNGNRFTVTITYRNETENLSAASAPIAECFTLAMTQGNGQSSYALTRNQLGYVPMTAVASDPGAANTTFSAAYLHQDDDGTYRITSGYLLGKTCKLISNAATAEVAKKKNYRIVCNLDATGVFFEKINSYYGHFDGNNKVVSNLTIIGTNSTGSSYCGMFYLPKSSAIIENIVLKDVTLQMNGKGATSNNVGAIVSKMEEPATIRNCTVDGLTFQRNVSTLSYNYDHVGGIVGNCSNSSAVSLNNNVVKNMTVTGYTNIIMSIGGIVGRKTGDGTLALNNCKFMNSTFTMTGVCKGVGGLIHYCNSDKGTLNNCEVSGVNITVSSAASGSYFGTLIADCTAIGGSGNTTSGSITISSKTGTIYYGSVANNFACGNSAVVAAGTNTLGMTISE